MIESWWHLTFTFDLESYFCTLSIQATYYEWLDLAISFSVWRYIFRISRSWFSFEIMGQRSKCQKLKIPSSVIVTDIPIMLQQFPASNF